MKKIVLNIGLAFVCALSIVIAGAFLSRAAITGLSGLAVAQSATTWNNVKDAALGDNLINGVLASQLYFFDGTNFDRARGDITNGLDVDVTRLPGTLAPADGLANPTVTVGSTSFNEIWCNATSQWNRARGAAEASSIADSCQIIAVAPYFYDSAGNNQPAQTAERQGDGANGFGFPASQPMKFNGSTYDRERSASATNNTAATSTGISLTTPVSTWSVTNTTAGASAASASKAAGGGTVRHVATSISICYNDTVAATTALQINLRDGATGAGTIIRSWLIAIPVAGQSQCIDLSGLNMSGSANTAMTLEFAAVGAASSAKTVTLTGYSTP